MSRKSLIFTGLLFFFLAMGLFLFSGVEKAEAYTCQYFSADNASYCIGVTANGGFNTYFVNNLSETFPAEAACGQSPAPGRYSNVPKGDYSLIAWCYYKGFTIEDRYTVHVYDGTMFSEILGPSSFDIKNASSASYTFRGGFRDAANSGISIHYTLIGDSVIASEDDGAYGSVSFLRRADSGCPSLTDCCFHGGGGVLGCNKPASCYYNSTPQRCYNYCQEKYIEVGCSLSCGVHNMTFSVSGGDMFRGFVTGPTATKRVNVTCTNDPPPPPSPDPDPIPDPDPDPIPDPDPSCNCLGWTNQGCGQGICSGDGTKMYQTRLCNPRECDITEQCVNDPTCTVPSSGSGVDGFKETR